MAGTDTTSATVEWAMAELLNNPEIMSKAQVELDQVIGKGNQVKESDIARLPYLQAVVKETFRLHPPVPLLLPRKAIADVEICGFTVPKGAQVLVNAWAIGRDSSIWDNSDKFMPERFLGSDIDVRGKLRAHSLWRWKKNMPWSAIGNENVALDAGFSYSLL